MVGKYDNVTLINTDFTDSFQFPALKRQGYIENHVKEGGNEVARVHLDFKGIQRSKILHLRSLPVFGMTGAAMQCTKFLINRIQNRSMWLGREILIHVEDIHKLTGLSTAGKDVSIAFQNTSKREKKVGDCDSYRKYETRIGGKGAKIDPINVP